MKKAWFFVCILSLLMTSCVVAGPTHANNTENNLLASSIPFIKVITPTSVPEKAVVKTTTSFNTIATDITPLLTKTPIFLQDCSAISIVDSFTSSKLNGTIPLLSTTHKIKDSYLLDLETDQEFYISEEEMETLSSGAVSPDGNWFSFIADSNPYQKDEFLLILNSKGIIEKRINLESIFEQEHGVILKGWTNNTHLEFVWLESDSLGYISPNEAITVNLNPFSGEWKKYENKFDDMFNLYPDYLLNWNENSYNLRTYNKTFDRLLYLSFKGVILWDTINQKQIKVFLEEPRNSISAPVWSPDGENFIIDLNTQTGRNFWFQRMGGKHR